MARSTYRTHRPNRRRRIAGRNRLAHVGGRNQAHELARREGLNCRHRSRRRSPRRALQHGPLPLQECLSSGPGRGVCRYEERQC